MTLFKLFLDSDVVISSSISKTGAAHFIATSPKFTSFISSYSKDELEKLVKRTNLNAKTLNKLINKNIKIYKLKETLKLIKERYKKYVSDKNDAHIVAGASEAKVDFLLTYNIKDFRIDKIKSDFDILVLTPGKFLQYLRSINKL